MGTSEMSNDKCLMTSDNCPHSTFGIRHLTLKTSITPLAMLRVLFGFIMLVSVIRFMMKGWVHELYVAPSFHFTFYGFDWIQPLSPVGMYVVFSVMAIAATMIMLGAYYRLAAVLFFLLFTYVELIDKANYLNHYYFVSLISCLLILVPANRFFSVDVWRKPEIEASSVPAWTINVFKLQIAIVYFYAGLAKLNPDWLFEAMPLRIWLPALAHLPLIGSLLALPETAYAFSWFGAFYDLTIVFFLLYHRTRVWAFAAVVAFHLMTGLLFQIGMFPYIMILSTLVFFSPAFHLRAINFIRSFFNRFRSVSTVGESRRSFAYRPRVTNALFGLLALYFVIQLLVPFRSALYPGSTFWTEQGYRFSWRVMLMEKAGYTVFRVQDPDLKQSWEVTNWDYLTPNQEKMMATQPDMILQFAHFLEDEYQKRGHEDVVITADAYVALNGRRSQRFIDPTVDLTEKARGLAHKDWILPFSD